MYFLAHKNGVYGVSPSLVAVVASTGRPFKLQCSWPQSDKSCVFDIDEHNGCTIGVMIYEPNIGEDVIAGVARRTKEERCSSVANIGMTKLVLHW